ncbi:hypothetical protein ACIQU6_28000 [Streptomyces sp. NPDC090442]|uniref:hypothetical protein n=1 Tax=Streptomyces sp. NPDC090442 TaxID=3365962 RepID=UPI0038136CE8
MNLTKTTCRFARCRDTSAYLVTDGMCSYLLCPTHTRRAVARLSAWIVASAAQTRPSSTA